MNVAFYLLTAIETMGIRKSTLKGCFLWILIFIFIAICIAIWNLDDEVCTTCSLCVIYSNQANYLNQKR